MIVCQYDAEKRGSQRNESQRCDRSQRERAKVEENILPVLLFRVMLRLWARVNKITFNAAMLVDEIHQVKCNKWQPFNVMMLRQVGANTIIFNAAMFVCKTDQVKWTK